jgi:hypothetical protein
MLEPSSASAYTVPSKPFPPAGLNVVSIPPPVGSSFAILLAGLFMYVVNSPPT